MPRSRTWALSHGSDPEDSYEDGEQERAAGAQIRSDKRIIV
jgi:hypothetical protein